MRVGLVSNFESLLSRVARGLIFLLVLLAISGCNTTHDEILSAKAPAITGQTMGTTYAVKVAELPVDIDTPALQQAIDERLESLNAQMSTWRPDSELSRFNAALTTDWFAVSPAVVEVVAEAQRVSELTGGAFDVTVEPLISLWGFDRDGLPDKIPTQEQIDSTKQRIGFRQLEFRTDPPALRKQSPELSVNLSAIAKGYGVDVIAQYLESLGIQDYLVEIGGEVRAKGTKPDGTAWVIGIEQPNTASFHESIRSIQPGSLGMATSGDYRNFYTRDGKTYSHTIDPKTGRPVESNLTSVTILAPTCMRADALATAIMVLGPEEGMRLAEQENLPVMHLVRSEMQGFTELSNAAFQNLEYALPQGKIKEQPLTVYLAALAVFVLALLGMAVGVILSNRRIKGSCGGLNNFKDEQGNSICDACTTPPEECERVREAAVKGQQVIENHGGTEDTEN